MKKTLGSWLLVGFCLPLGLAAAQSPAAPVAPAPVAAAPAAPAPAPATPSASADDLLRQMDRQANAFGDATFRFKLIIKETNGAAREFEFRTQQKGQKRLVRFLSPATIKGMGVLVENPDTMYVLLPEFNNRVRRVGTHQAGQSFMGSDVSNSDMSLTELAPVYTATFAGSEGTQRTLELTARPGIAAEFPRLRVVCDPGKGLIAKIEYLDASGKKLRTQERLEYKQDSGKHASPGRVVFTDHRKNNHQTELVLLESKLDTGLTDDNFTQRALTRM